MRTLPLSAALGEARDLQAQGGLPADGPLAAGARGAELLDGLSALLDGGPPTTRRAGGAEQRLSRAMGRAITDWDMIREGDRVMVAVSGGKDSYTMLRLLERLRRKAPVKFSLVAVNLDQGHPGYPGHLLEGWLRAEGFAHHMLKQDTYSVVQARVPPGKTTCSLCSRLRRGILYSAAVELGCTRIALGHHRDDLIETLVLNLLFSGQLKAMPPLLHSDDGRNTVIRPMAYCEEADIIEYAAQQDFPIIPCDLCGSQEQLQRKRVKQLLAGLAAENPKIPANIFAAMQNVRPSHLLDPALRAAAGLSGGAGDDEELLDIG
jgi:tRNA 2-thiocytidine biosynthesis protein TtcA